MKNYKQITYRYLKGQRNRTLLTILGIILSVALVSAIGTIILSVKDALIIDAIKENGSYHSIFKNVEGNIVDKIINHVGVEEWGVSKREGIAPIVETTEEERNGYGINIPYRYIEINAYDNKSLDMLPFNLKEGRFPKTQDEIAIEYWMADYFDNKITIGDKINIPIGNRIIEENKDGAYIGEVFQKTKEKEYTVVGFIKPRYLWRTNLITQGIIGLESRSYKGDDYNVYITIPNIKDANDKILSIADDIKIDPDNIDYNNRVLRLYAESLSNTFNKSLMALVIFIIGLIVVSTIAVIYNAFNISVLERIRQFGLLRSIGATPSQIRGIVLKEALTLSLVGIPLGLFSGVLAMKVVLYIIGLIVSSSGSMNSELINIMEIHISGMVFLISTIIGLITVFLSAIGPARQAAKVSPLEAVRNTGSIKKDKFRKTKGASSIIRKIMGVEGEIAYKNLKRNRKRFFITVFSMVISISLFITFSTFSDYVFKMGAIESNDMGDFQLYGDIDKEYYDKIYGNLSKMKDIDKIFTVMNDYGEVLVKENQINKKMVQLSPYLLNEKKDDLVRINNVDIFTIGNDNFKELKSLLKEGTIDIDRLNQENGVLVINNTYVYKDDGGRILIDGFNIKTGDTIPFASYRDNKEGETQYKELKIMGVLEKGILDYEYNYNGSLNIITTDEVFNRLCNSHSNKCVYLTMAEDGNIENIRTYLKEIEESTPYLHYIDYAEVAKENRVMGIVLSIFLYGFVTIISIISSINIINTISTNIILRTREIAMIKAVGMDQSRIKRMVSLESLFYGLYGAIFGGTIGSGLTYILFRIIGGISGFEYKLPFKNIFIACVGATIIALLSGVYPLKRINDKIIVESMKAEN